MRFFTQLFDILLRIEELIACLVSLQNKGMLADKKMQRMENYQHNYLDKQEVTQLLKISERQLYNLRKKHHLPYRLISGKLYFKLTDIEKLSKR
ncbi:helix-turn-helix domain-containing protein [Pedobacter glucosidilyticus]|uniref:helix-turn-helix domain-containing protein n=1 Tax=Pedobacter glucosidilyticus TaxID=1122941 RepID=UPI0006858CA2|nr:helix-turn-helix domain-containing protein [Pedobacter glucosidilyticus]